MVKVALWEVRFFISELFPGGRCVPESAGVSVRPPPFLSDALSLLSQLWLVTWGAQTHMRFFRARSQLSLFTVGLFCFQCSNSVMGIPFTLWQLNKCKSLREAWMKLVFHLPQEKWEAGRDEHQTWGEEAAEQSFTQGSHHEASPGAPLHWKFQ